MILLISSSLGAKNDGVKRLASALSHSRIEYTIIDPHSLVDDDWSLVQRNESIELLHEGRVINPSTIIITNPIRCDSIIRLPSGGVYPGLFRHGVTQFVNDLRFSFESARWLPGRIEDIERADSKLAMFRAAKKCGIVTPAFTFDTKAYEGPMPVYRKCLGYPFLISYNAVSKKEVGITVTSVFHDTSDTLPANDGSLWQWQETIDHIAQIRSYVVSRKMWSVVFDKESSRKFGDLRLLTQIQNEEITWKTYELPREIQNKIFMLMDELRIHSCAPEFLVTSSGAHVLIDLNPCGDWFGFFERNVNEEICDALVCLL